MAAAEKPVLEDDLDLDLGLFEETEFAAESVVSGSELRAVVADASEAVDCFVEGRETFDVGELV